MGIIGSGVLGSAAEIEWESEFHFDVLTCPTFVHLIRYFGVIDHFCGWVLTYRTSIIKYLIFSPLYDLRDGKEENMFILLKKQTNKQIYKRVKETAKVDEEKLSI